MLFERIDEDADFVVGRLARAQREISLLHDPARDCRNVENRPGNVVLDSHERHIVTPRLPASTNADADVGPKSPVGLVGALK